MNWISANAAALLALAIVTWLTIALLRALLVSARNREQPSVTEAFSRTEKVRAGIRRKIAARKANPADASADAPQPDSPVKTFGRLRPIDPFGGPGRRWWNRVRGWFSRRA